ncbi:hypothetical protein [Absidia glauca]|uniref:Uncharacterized protein n=1 Tax=Absidia glauca TaxID=4829 RepID=A0A163IQ33_ABSGL|nr:hypothetical protein [Absidia glauca]
MGDMKHWSSCHHRHCHRYRRRHRRGGSRVEKKVDNVKDYSWKSVSEFEILAGRIIPFTISSLPLLRRHFYPAIRTMPPLDSAFIIAWRDVMEARSTTLTLNAHSTIRLQIDYSLLLAVVAGATFALDTYL